VGALVLALPQLLPTLELTSISNRSGGMTPNQATAFSFNPFLAGRGLLSSYDLSIFAEYIAYPGIIAFGLAVVGVMTLGKRETTKRSNAHVPVWVWLAFVVIGLLFAFGQYNPLYWQLAGLPGFNLFRVPARWLVLFALGVAMLAGYGAHMLIARRVRPTGWHFALITALVGGLAAAARWLTDRNPEPVPYSAPNLISYVGWAVALVAMLLVLAWVRGKRALPAWLLIALVSAELFAASFALPYHQLVPPEVLTSQRFTTSQLRVFDQAETPMGRLLSIGDLLFDPGDRAVLEARYRSYGMTDEEIRIALVGTKLQETLSANLPLYWGIPTIDGFDGGVLPTKYYTAFTSLIIPAGELRTIDGRLREALTIETCYAACIPDMRWLNLTNTEYLLLDKVFDVWHEGIAYDTGLPLRVNDAPQVIALPAFEATAVDLLVEGEALPTLSVNGQRISLASSTSVDGFVRARYAFDGATTLTTITASAETPLNLRALTLVDERTGDFQQVGLGEWSRILSSDIKLYQNAQVMPRAFVVFNSLWVEDTDLGTESALQLMGDGSFDPRETVILHSTTQGTPQSSTGSATAIIRAYTPTRVVIDVTSEAAGYLVLSDAYYPGWRALVNDTPTEITRADIMFRAVPVAQGESTVIFEYQPLWLSALPILGIMWLTITILIITILYVTKFRSQCKII
jgi:Bacterial membrane protein YfhO